MNRWLARPLRLRDHPRLAFVVTLAVGLALAGAAAFWEAAGNTRAAQLRFDTLAKNTTDRLAGRLRRYQFALRGARGMVLANGPGLIGERTFSRYIGSLDVADSYPGLREIGLVWRVARTDERDYVAQLRSSGNPGFGIHEFAPHLGDRYVNTFSAPRETSQAIPGFDLASEPKRREVADLAMRTGRTSMSAPVVRLLKTGPAEHFYLLMLPIYREGVPVDTAAGREAATVGWVASALLIEKALANLGLDDNRFSMSLRDVGPGSGETGSTVMGKAADTGRGPGDAHGDPPFLATANAALPAADGIAARIELPVYGRTWQIDLRARPAFLQETNQAHPLQFGAFGGLLAVALAALAHTVALGRRREMEVFSEQARRAAIVDGSNDAILCQGLDGRVTDWNPGAARLFGYPAGAVIGRPLAEVLLPPSRKSEDAEIRAALLRGEPVVAFDTVRLHRDGRLLDVSLSASPIMNADGRCIGVAKTMRDVSAARRAASELQELNASLENRVAERTGLLEAARHDLQAILDALPIAIAYWDRTLHSRFRNRAHREWFGDGPRPETQAADRRCTDRPGSNPHITELLGADYANRAPEVEAALRGTASVRERESLLPGSRVPRHTVNHYLPDLQGGQVQGFYVMGHDVTAAKLAEQRLRASEEFLDRAGEIAGVGGWALDLKTMTLSWSAHTYRIHELSPDQLPDVASAIEYYAPEARPIITAAVEKGTADGTPWDLELPFITATGRRLWVRTQGKVDMEDGRAVRLIGAFQDITDRKLAAARLEQAHDRFAIAADSAHIGVWEYDPATDTSLWDERMYRLYGLPPADSSTPHTAWLGCVHPADSKRVSSLRAAALRGDCPYETEYRIVCPDGTVRHLRASARVIVDSAGAPLRMTGVNIDITEQKQAELELIQTSSLLHTVLDSASEVSIIAGDPQMKITVFNKGAERLLGYDAQEVVGKTGAQLQIHDRLEVAGRAADMSRSLGREVRGAAVFTDPSALGQPREWNYRRKDGSRVRVSLIVTAMRDAAGGLLGYLGIAHDVTRQKEHEASLRKAMHKARQASLAKSQFLANMSHEIRTPMNAVIGLTYLLGQSPLDPQQADMVGKLRIAGKSLLGIINDVLDLSKIEANELTLERAPFALRGVLSDLTALMSVQAGTKGIRFSVDAPADLPLVLDGDATRLGQVLTNLVANAIKFTERGGVKLSVALRGALGAPSAAGESADAGAGAGETTSADAGDGDRASSDPARDEPAGNDPINKKGESAAPARTVRLRFTVRDSGIGIPLELQPRLFAPFMQADASTKRRFGGTGLGLSIVKRLVDLMGGAVFMESLVGVGSTFWFDVDLPVLDVASTGEATLATPQARSLQGLRILLTDDSDINLEVASRILMRHGANITLARDGQQAVDLLRLRPDGYDLVLMDVQMPVLDGHEATQRIRHELGLVDLPVIALTAGALTAEHDSAGAAGMNDFIRKPFDAHGLVRTVLRHARPNAAQPVVLGNSGWGSDAVNAAAAVQAQAQGSDGWPEIAGIDRADVRARLGGDVNLFASMLERLLREFAEVGDGLIGSSPGSLDPDALADLGARMHKLKGSASTLGATAISRLAGRAEDACRARQAERARHSALELAAQLKTLSGHAVAVLDSLRSRSAAAGRGAGREGGGGGSLAAATGGDTPEPQRLRELLVLFDEQSLGALERFDELVPQLQSRLGERRFRMLQDHVGNLEFEEAARMLRAVGAGTAAAGAEAAAGSEPGARAT